MQSKFFTPFIILTLALGALSASAQTPFFTENFSDQTASLANWTHGGTNEGTETWKWSNDPSRGGFLPYAAPTAADGFMYFDSDANGLNDHAVTLTRGPIDCSGKTDVWLELFAQYVYYAWDEGTVEIGVSTNGTDFVYRPVLEDVEPGYIYATAQRVVLQLPEAINSPTVYLQIKWTGSFEYFLHIDDVALYESAPILANDLDIFDVRQPSAYATPVSQIDTTFFWARAENIGADPQTNVRTRATVFQTVGEDLVQVFRDSSENFPVLNAGAETDTLMVEQGFLPTVTGEYTVLQTVRADEDDDFGANNTHIFEYVVTENVFAVDDGDLQGVALPGDFNGDFWEGGNLYTVLNGAGYVAENAQFVVFDTSGLGGHVGKTITILLFKLAINDDAVIDNNDFETVGFSAYTFTPDDSNEGGFSLITAPLYQDDGETVGIPLEDSTDYLLMLSLPQDIGIIYTYRDVIYELSSVVRNGPDWFLGGFGDGEGNPLPIALMVRMGIAQQDVPAKEPELADSRIASFPNPATDLYRIDLDLESVSPVQVQLMSMSGQVIQQRSYTALQQDRIELNVSDLAAGAYLVKVRTDEGVKTLKLTKM